MPPEPTVSDEGQRGTRLIARGAATPIPKMSHGAYL
jgi:hypothetical protein